MTAQTLRQRGHKVTLWLSGRDTETAVIKGWDGPVVRLAARGFQERWSAGGVGVAAGHAGACLHAAARMRTNRPDVLLGMGSYSSVPPVLAAWVLRVPIILHEANAIPGRAVSFLARFARAVGVAFESAGYHFPRGKAVRTGLPMRPLGTGRLEGAPLTDGVFTILVMGGSQGAHVLNEVVPVAAGRLRREGRALQVVHLAGKADGELVRAAYAAEEVPCQVFGFLEDMDKAYNVASLAVCRSGAGSCMELARYGVPAILVPLPTARRNHQWLNAKEIQQRGGAQLLEQRALTPERLAMEIASLMEAPDRRNRMRAALQGLAIPDGAERLANLVESVIGG